MTAYREPQNHVCECGHLRSQHANGYGECTGTVQRISQYTKQWTERPCPCAIFRHDQPEAE